MKDTNHQYWQSLAEWTPGGNLPIVTPEFEELPRFSEGHTRRDFLSAAGFTLAVATLSGCSRSPVDKVAPYTVQPEETVAGRAQYYASICGECTAGCGMLVKVQDGRPIKLEGNPDHPISRGALCAAGQASILGLYDSLRLTQPFSKDSPVNWPEIDNKLKEEFARIREQRLAVRYLSGTVISPTKRWMIERFISSFDDAKHIEYSSNSHSTILEAHAKSFGRRVVPRLRFDRAKVIVSFDADFLGTWISPVEFARGWAAGRSPSIGVPLSYHVQFESRLTTTGSKADRRYLMTPSQIESKVRALARALAGNEADDLADSLRQARGQSLVVSGSQSIEVQVLVIWINQTLGNYGATLDLAGASLQAREDDGRLASLIHEIQDGQVGALIVDSDANPAYDFQGHDIVSAIGRIPVVVSLSSRLDETASISHWICPDSHYLETWSDAEAVRGIFSIGQPAIRRFGTSRPVIESLAAWLGQPKTDFALVQEFWQSKVFSLARATDSFAMFWDRTVHDGFVELPATRHEIRVTETVGTLREDGVQTAGTAEDWVVFYPKVSMRDVRHAYNPWLLELPDPISRVTWGNYACVSPEKARQLDIVDGDVVRLAVNGSFIEIPALVQPGMHDHVVAVALGYGAKLSGRFKDVGPRWFWRRDTVDESGVVGVNAAPLLFSDSGFRLSRVDVRISKTGRRYSIASTQDHHRLAITEASDLHPHPVRPAIQETSLQQLANQATRLDSTRASAEGSLWPADHRYEGHRWGMAIDLNACNGCSACVVACQVENNVPVVGKDEVRRHRIMHWIRIDRYFSGTPAEPDVAFQPMLCQHCENAPCEAVCPTLATTHSGEGLNQQVYNRCVGTRYCANNCPYKVRRFNWFDYPHEDRLANMVLNPDVTVRSRGVMEKCTFCVQRINEARAETARSGRPMSDGDIRTACQQSCPSNAIVFGDINDPHSQVSQILDSRRRYHVLEHLNVRPSIGYLKIVRNRTGDTSRHG